MGIDLTCTKCGSTKVVPRARVIDRFGDHSFDGNVRLGVYRKPEAWLFKDQELADVYARVCGECGFIELFADDAPAIYRAYLDSRQNPE